MRPRSSAPRWFVFGMAVAVALCVRLVAGMHGGLSADAGDGHPVQLALWPFLIIIGEAIWKGIEVAAKATLIALQWSVKWLWVVMTKVGNGLKVVGVALRDAGKHVWEFFRDTYDHVLKPAWTKLRLMWEDFRFWLDDTFGPILDWLRAVRDWTLCFWKTYIRPWLDLIDITRRVLRVLNQLGLHWAGELERRLGALEDKLTRPFTLLLAKVNEIINLVNRVITLDGLLQRFALISSLGRDYKYAWQAIVNPYSKPIPDDARPALPELHIVTGLDDVVPGIRVYLADGSGPYAEEIRELAATWRALLRSR